MIVDPENDAIGLIRHRNVVLIYCMPRWAWILDGNKWNASWIAAGKSESDFEGRCGIRVLDEHSVDAFVAMSSRYLLDLDRIKTELLSRLRATDSWWDVEHLFPKLFVDFDRRELLACYGFEGHPTYERYVPPGWRGDVVDFMQASFPEDLMPVACRYWIVDGDNLIDGLRT